MAFTQITITASDVRADGTPAQGTVTATLSEQIQNGTAVIDPTPIAGTLNVEGDLVDASAKPFVLVATNDPATLPQGATYEFVIELDSAPLRSGSAIVPYNAAAGTVDLSVLVPSP
jgi:hypothetical protein